MSAHSPLKVLILEDQPADAELILDELRQSGFEPNWERVQTKAAYIAALTPNLDIILADYKLPQFDGLTALSLVQESGLDIPFILVSGSIGEEQAASAMRQGAADYLLKDRLARLGHAVSKALDDKRLRDKQRITTAELRQVKQFNESIVQNMTESIVILDAAGFIVFANPATAALIGYPPSEANGLGRVDMKHFIPPDQYPVFDAAADHLAQGESIRFELDISGKDGTRRTVIVNSAPQFLEDRVAGTLVVLTDITERKRAETELRKLYTAVEQSGNPVIMTDLQGNIEYVNPGFTRVTGYTSDEAIGKNPRILKSGETPPHVYKSMWDTIISGRVWRGEFHNRRKNGELFWELATISPVKDNEGHVNSILAVKEDITERKLSEQRIYESERFADATVNALSSEIAILDETGVILKVNKAWKTFAAANNGSAENTGEGINYLSVLDQTDAGAPDAMYAFAFAEGLRAVMNGSVNEYALEYPCDGPTEKRWFVGKVTHFEGDGPLRLVVAHENITQRKLSEIALQEANAELQALHATVSQQNMHLEQVVEERTAQLSRANDHLSTILNNTSDAILLLDAQDRIETVNTGFSNLFGYGSDESNGQLGQSLIAYSYREQFIAALRHAHADNLTQRVQMLALRKDSRTFDADISLTHVENNQGHLVCSIRDITALRALERAKDTFLSMVSHELRTPVATIALSSESLSLYYERIPEEKKKLKILQIHQQTTVLAELINAILDTARFDATSHEETSVSVDIQRALHEVITEMLPHAEAKEQRIEISHDIVPIMVDANATDISRVWRNLISNAIKYTGTGSTITTSLLPPALHGGARPAYPDLSSFGDKLPSDLTTGNYVVGLVEDNGPGIPDEHMSQMFTRFFRGWASSTDIPGTGLGLSLVRDILRTYHGDIAVSNKPTGGSRFCFWLPLSAGHMQPGLKGELS